MIRFARKSGRMTSGRGRRSTPPSRPSCARMPSGAGATSRTTPCRTCSYLKTQVARQVIDYHRRAKARCRDATVELDGIEIAVPAVVSQVVEAREEAEIRVWARARAVSGWRCSDRTRAIFEACTSGGRTTAEVAREFGVSPGFVRIIRHRGLAKERKATKRM